MFKRLAKRSPYLISGRLSDVIAAIQVMAIYAGSEELITTWSQELSRSRSEECIQKWTSIFREHPEFFLYYELGKEGQKKAALHLRYTNRSIDRKTGRRYSYEERKALPNEERGSLTSLPLDHDVIDVLVRTAIGMHTSVIAETASRRWWFPVVFPAAFGLMGVLAGALLGNHAPAAPQAPSVFYLSSLGSTVGCQKVEAKPAPPSKLK